MRILKVGIFFYVVMKMMLGSRLRLIYDMIPPCDILSDIGTDHALLPAYALMMGKCKKAIACDVRKGPLESAERTIKQYNLKDNIELRLGDGLKPISEEEADCIVMAGMGGLLIADIINNSMDIAKLANNIILQPMTRQEAIRPFLWQHGFEVLDEGLAREGEKLYQALRVRYTGVIRKSWNPINEVIGERLIEKRERLLADFIKQCIRRQEKIVGGLLAAKLTSESLPKEKALLDELKKLLESLGASPGGGEV